MSDMQRLMALLESAKLLHPVSDALSIVDFANALHSVMGIPDVPLNEKAVAIKGLIGEHEHLVLVMADGFGMNFVEGLEGDAFIPSHLAAEMRTVFPSTTPIALTSLATGDWPRAHGVIGWFVKLTEIDAISTIISYVRTSDKKPLSELGAGVEDAYSLPSRIGDATREAFHILPEQIAGSVYSNYWAGGVSQSGYDVKSPEQGVRMALEAVRAARSPTFVYLYLPQVDGLAHKLGASDEATLNAAVQVDKLLGTLATELPSNARMVMTADHGHLDALPHSSYSLTASDEIVRLCDGALTGDQRAIYAHVVKGKIDDFKEAVHRRCGSDFLVLTAEEVEAARLLGAGALSVNTRYRMGNALVLSTGNAVLDYRAVVGDDPNPIVSHHGGLTPNEMRIPLVTA
ncbi:MAG: alkaline phosphatase family protein [Chloroflexi bacterium]|nr:alkaline phosphatase family protein [Chloroflexota bacterium]